MSSPATNDKEESLEMTDIVDTSGQIGLRNFRHAPDFERFYRFIHEYELRREAKMVLDRVVAHLAKNKKKRKSK